MPKINCIHLATAAVFILGLTSCRRDGGITPPNPPRVYASPRIVRHNASLDLNSWKADSNHDLNLGEYIELGDPGPPYTEIHTTCGRGADAQTYHSTFQKVGKIPIYRFMPEKILAQNLKVTPADCHFIIQMGEDSVRKNGYEMVAQVKGDFGRVHLQRRDQVLDGETIIRTKDLLDYKVNLPNVNDADAELICNDMTYAKIPFSGDLDLMNFRLDQPHLRPETSVQAIVENQPDQSCRVVLSNPRTGGREEMTELFTLRLNQERWTIVKVDHPETIQGTMHQGQILDLATYQIKNVEDEPLHIRFNKDWYGTELTLNPKADQTAIARVDGPAWTRLFREGLTNLEWQKSGDVLTIRPHQQINVHLRYTAGGDIHCDHLRVRVKVKDEIFVHEVNANGNVIASRRLDAPPELNKIQYQPAFNFDAAHEHRWDVCHW